MDTVTYADSSQDRPTLRRNGADSHLIELTLTGPADRAGMRILADAPLWQAVADQLAALGVVAGAVQPA